MVPKAGRTKSTIDQEVKAPGSRFQYNQESASHLMVTDGTSGHMVLLATELHKWDPWEPSAQVPKVESKVT